MSLRERQTERETERERARERERERERGRKGGRDRETERERERERGTEGESLGFVACCFFGQSRRNYLETRLVASSSNSGTSAH